MILVTSKYNMHCTFLHHLFRVVFVVCKGRDPIRPCLFMGTYFFQILPVLQPTAFHWHPACVQRHCTPSIGCEVHRMFAGRLLRLHIVGRRCPVPPVPSHFDPFCTFRTCPLANQRLLRRIQGGNCTLQQFLCGHGTWLSTKQGSRQIMHCPKQTHLSHISTVPHADPGCST